MSSTTKHRKEMKWSKSVPESFAPLEYDEDIEYVIVVRILSEAASFMLVMLFYFKYKNDFS